MARIASFHLVREPTWKTPLALARLGTDRIWLRRTRGLVFWRLLGTGAGDHTGPGADLARTALFAVWDDEAALDDVPARRVTSPAGGDGAQESWHVRLRGVGGHGRWRGVDPLDGLEAGSADGPVAIITRADVRRHSWKAFGAASDVVDAELHDRGGSDRRGRHRRGAGRAAGDVQSVGDRRPRRGRSRTPCPITSR